MDSNKLGQLIGALDDIDDRIFDNLTTRSLARAETSRRGT